MKDYYFGNLTRDGVLFSVGRDVQLQPSPVAKSVNFLIYPYAEVDGKPHSQFNTSFRYEDVK